MAVGFLLVLGGVEASARVVGPRTRLDVDVLETLLDDHRVQSAAASRGGQQEDNQLDVVVVGSSTAGAGVDPAVLAEAIDPVDPQGYVLWIPGANAAVLEIAATEMLPALVEPEVVVVALTSRELNDNYDIGAFEVGLLPENLANSLAWRRITTPDQWGTRSEATASDLSGLVRYRARLREPTSWISWITSDDDGAPWQMTQTGRLAAYVESSAPLEASSGHLNREERVLSNYAAGGTQTVALTNALQAPSGQRVLLVVLPTSQSTFWPLHPNGSADVALAREAAALAAEQAGVEFLDLSDFGNDDSWFSDSNHLNSIGSAQVSDLIAAALS